MRDFGVVTVMFLLVVLLLGIGGWMWGKTPDERGKAVANVRSHPLRPIGAPNPMLKEWTR